MVRWPLASVLVLAAALAGCEGDSPPSNPSPPSGSGETISGRERLGWMQTSTSASDMNVLQFAAYVDGSRRVLEGFTCSPSGGNSFECSAPLPSLGAGRHTIEVASFFDSDGIVLESPKSPALQVVVSGILSPAPPGTSGEGSFPAGDGRSLYAQLLADDLVDPVDVAVDGRQRAFVVERRGTLRIIEEESSSSRGATRVEPLFGSRDQGSEALSVALAPDFASSNLIYTLSAQPSANGARLFVTRFRELQGTLGEAAVVASHEMAATAPDGALRFGPDGAMYIAAGSAEAPSGRILRFLADGRIPRDNPDGSPLYSLVELMPAGLDWQAADVSLWTVQTGRAIDRLEVRRRVGDTGDVAVAPQSLSTSTSAPRLPRGTRASGLAIVNAASSPFDGDAIVSSIGLADLLRFDGSRTRAPGGDPVRLLNGRFGAIGGVTATPNGDIYFFTQNNEAWATGRDVLVRLRLE